MLVLGKRTMNGENPQGTQKSIKTILGVLQTIGKKPGAQRTIATIRKIGKRAQQERILEEKPGSQRMMATIKKIGKGA